MKSCTRCGALKPIDEFHRRKAPDGRQVWCKACRKVYDRAYHQATREIRIEQKRVLKGKMSVWLRSVKERPGADCGGCFHPVAMHFDHRPGEEKEFEIGSGIRRYSRKRILSEMAKCDLVCANCHAVRTYLRQIGA